MQFLRGIIRPAKKTTTKVTFESGAISIAEDHKRLVTHKDSISGVTQNISSHGEDYTMLDGSSEYGFFTKTDIEQIEEKHTRPEGIGTYLDLHCGSDTYEGHTSTLGQLLKPMPSASSMNVELVNKVNSSSAAGQRSVSVYNFERLDYATAWAYQKHIVEEFVRKGDKRGDMILLLEHDPVFTIGRRPKFQYLNFDPSSTSIKLFKVERGGEVTYHGPGQVVAYPLLDLGKYKKDLHWYLRQLEEVVMVTLSQFGVEGWRDKEYTGVWVTTSEGPRKIAAIGSAVSKWKTYHGISLNVNADLEPFNMIVPCGIDGRGVVNLSDLVSKVDVLSVRLELIAAFERVFDMGCSIEDSRAVFDNLELQYSQPDVITSLS